jgi:hypothetical protein
MALFAISDSNYQLWIDPGDGSYNGPIVVRKLHPDGKIDPHPWIVTEKDLDKDVTQLLQH